MKQNHSHSANTAIVLSASATINLHMYANHKS